MRTLSNRTRFAAYLPLLACAALEWIAGPALAQSFETILNTNLFQPASVSVTPLNQYVISDTANHRIVQFNPDNRAFAVVAGPDRAPLEQGAVDGQRIDARFRNPQSVLCIGDKIYVADTGNHVIREIDAAGNVTTIAGDLAAAHEVDDFGGLPQNWGFVDGAGASARFNGPCGLAADGENHLFISDSGNRAIRILDLETHMVTTAVRSGLVTPVSVAVGMGGALFISDTGAHSIKIWHPGDTKAALVAGGGTPLSRGFRNSSVGTNALFSAPAGIFYREATDELVVADSGNAVLRTIQGASGTAPKVATFANTETAGFQTPIAVTRDLYGVYLVCDSTRNALAQVITVRLPRIEKPRIGQIIIVLDPISGLPVAQLAPVTDATFDNMVRIAVSGDDNGQHYYTYSSSTNDVPPPLPTTNSTTVPNFVSPQSPPPPNGELNNKSINSTAPPRYNFRVKVFTGPKANDERIPSLATEAVFRFKCATPVLDSQSVPGRLLFRCNTTNADIYYTTDGSEPIKGNGSAKFLPSGESIPLILTTNSLVVKARAYLDSGFLPSDVARAEYSPENFIPNRISLGFENGEASTDMLASPGQRYFAPVTLSLMPGAKAYGLQFDLSLEPLSGPSSSDYHLAFNSSFIDTLPPGRIIPPSVYVLTGTNYVTNTVHEITTNWTYEVTLTNFASLPGTNYVLLTNKLADVVPIVTSTFITNLGQQFPVLVTNYVTNSFRLVADNSTTNVTEEVDTNYLYRYTSPSVTNQLHVSDPLPESTPVVVTNFVSNLGKLFSFNTTNYLTNSFNLVSSGTLTNVTRTVDTNYTYQAVAPATTNYLTLAGTIPESAQVIVTNFIQNLGQSFPITTTNTLTNGFDLVSVSLTTNTSTSVLTNFDYRAVTPGQSNLFVLNELLADSTPVIVTNFVTNLGRLFPVVSTNYISNSFNLLSVTVVTNTERELTTNFVYDAQTPAQTNYLVLDRVLTESTTVITTNFLPNMGELFPVLSTNRITNAFNLISARYETNTTSEISSNFVYEVQTPHRTDTLVLDRVLPDKTTVITTNLIANLGEQFPVLSTNYISNSFNLFSVDVVTNVALSITTNFDYRAVTPGTTSYVTVSALLPDTTPVVVTNLIPNLGQLFAVPSTNYISNAFNLLSVAVVTNTTRSILSNYVYEAATPAVTNTLILDRVLPEFTEVITTNFLPNLGSQYPLLSTNRITNAFNLVSAGYATNVVRTVASNFLYQVVTPAHSDLITLDHFLPDSTPVVTTNLIPNLGEFFPVATTNYISNAFNFFGVDILTNTVTSVLTNYQYRSVTQSTTNLVRLNTLLPDRVPVVITNQISNLGQQFPVVQTNFITNAFDLVSWEINTNPVSTVTTSIVYRSISQSATNYLTVHDYFPEQGPVVTTFVTTNQGSIYALTSTNYAPNVFELVSADIATNVVNRLSYEYSYPQTVVTDFLVWPEPLPSLAQILLTNNLIVTNQLGGVVSFAIPSTHILSASDFVSAVVDYSGTVGYLYQIQTTLGPGTLVATNPISFPASIGIQATGYVPGIRESFSHDYTTVYPNPVASAVTNTVLRVDVSTNIVYRFRTPMVTNYITLSTNLPDVAPVTSTVTITNLGQSYTAIVTNYATNAFELVSTSYATNVQAVVTTNALYQFRSPGATNLITLSTNLPDYAPVITTTFLTNLGQLFPITTTNLLANNFELLGQTRLTNVSRSVTTNVSYLFFTPGVTNYVFWPELLPDVEPVVTTNFISNLGRQFPVAQTNYLTNAFTLVGSSYFTNDIVQVSTNVVYEFRTPGSSTLVNVTGGPLPDRLPVVTTNFISNLGQVFPVAVTNYVTNSFRLVSSSVETNNFVSLSTNVLYAFSVPSVTNFLSLPTKLDDFAPVVTTTFLTNLGQVFPINTTNYVANSFDFLGSRVTTNLSRTVETNVTYLFEQPSETFYLELSELLPPRVAVVTTNFIENLGRQFPVAVTNFVTNTFRLVESNFTTNRFETVQTNILYAFTTSGTTNRVLWPELLPDSVAVVTTNFVSNLGQLFPVAVTNYLTNSFRLVGQAVQTNDFVDVHTNVVYGFSTPGITNYLSLGEKLPASLQVITTNFISNLGQLYPIAVTNIVFNTFEFLGTNYVTNTSSTVSTNVLYSLRTPSITNIVFWPVKLPDFITVISTNFITNLGQLFPVTSTNIVANQFQLLSTNYNTNTTFDIQTNIVYEFHTPGTTNFFEVPDLLPAYVQVVTTNFVTNVGQLFPVRTTNITANIFDLISTNLLTNTLVEITPSFIYEAITPGGGGSSTTVTTNLLTVDSPLADVLPVVRVVGFVTNLTELIPVYSTNYITNTLRLLSTSFLTNTVRVSTTNVPNAFVDLVLTNYSQSYLAVGWIESFGQTNLYNTLAQDLLAASQPHSYRFESRNGEAVAGSFSFIVPTNAASGNEYRLRVSRPSATADGISQDMYLQAPDENDDKSPVKAVKTLVVTNRVGYLVGDVSNFRWFNAGEFGDTNLLNNDLTELQRVIVYGLNVPPEDSDFLDAMDTCCYTEAGEDLSNIEFASSALDINQIAFGEGSRYAPYGKRPNAELAVNDLFVAFRRSLDPDLYWYQRYWSNGTRQATIVPNTFRGGTTGLRRQSVSALSLPVGPTIQSTQAPALTVYAGTAQGLPGMTVSVPVRVRVDGGFPLRTLLFNARVESADGSVVPSSTLDIAVTDALGLPYVQLNDEAGRSGAAWLDTTKAGVLGEQVIGRVLFTIPANATPNSLYYVKLDRVSGSPNGVSLFPARSGNGLVAMSNRTTPVWNDGIPDAWRMQYFGTLTNARSAAAVDADGDGLSNYEEYKLGTNPTDPSDSLRVHALQNGRGLKLRFHTASGHKYIIEGSSNLLPGSWTTVQSNVIGTGGDLELPSSGGAHSFYYRVRLQE